MSQSVRRRNDPESEVNSEPRVLVIVGVTVEGGAISTQDVLQPPVREATPLRRGHHHQAISCGIHPLIGRPEGRKTQIKPERLTIYFKSSLNTLTEASISPRRWSLESSCWLKLWKIFISVSVWLDSFARHANGAQALSVNWTGICSLQKISQECPVKAAQHSYGFILLNSNSHPTVAWMLCFLVLSLAQVLLESFPSTVTIFTTWADLTRSTGSLR